MRNKARRLQVFAMAMCAAAAVVTGCGHDAFHPEASHQGAACPGLPVARQLPASQTALLSAADSVLADSTPSALTATFACKLFTSAPVVVVASGSGETMATVQKAARTVHAPLLLAPDGVNAALAAAIKGLQSRAVLVMGSVHGVLAGELAAWLPGVHVATSAADLPVTGLPVPLRGVAVLVSRSDPAPEAAAITTTARVAGATVVAVADSDPRADPAAIRALTAVRPREVLAIGSGFGTPGLLASRVAAAATGIQLPGGGQVVFPEHRLVALYGYPGIPSLGALGEQDLSASIARAQQFASEYQPLSKVPVIPAFEIIATMAQASPGADGSYSHASNVSTLWPWVRQATSAGMYVILDLQPGRASLLTQAERYQPLLALPNVGLALDAEWKLQPGQLPLHQIGSVSIGEVNSVVRWLATLTARYRLPQKVLVLHQFKLSMIQDEQALDTSHDHLAIVVHMDGQGTPQMKQDTWDSVIQAAPQGVSFGWKNFLVKDQPMLSPQETMAKTPTPVMISYQ